MSVSLLIAGDVVPYGRTIPLFENKETDVLFGEMKRFITGTDFSIVNLEAPIITGHPSPIRKNGPALSASPKTLEVIKEAGFNIVTLANNHFYDQGDLGVRNTLTICKQLGLDTVGGGRCYTEARKILYLKKNGITIAILNVCEHEFSIAVQGHGGSNPLDIIDMLYDIKEAKDKADYAVIIVHGGVEHYKYPTPRMKKLYRFFIDSGADVVVNHHQHCMCGYEVYKNRPIFYGEGNLNFQPSEKHKGYSDSNYGYVVRITFDKGIFFEMIPYIQNGDTSGIAIRDRDEFTKEISALSTPISDDFILGILFDQHVASNQAAIKLRLIPSILRNRIIDGLLRRGFPRNIYDDTSCLDIYNLLHCESHRDVLNRIFQIDIMK